MRGPLPLAAISYTGTDEGSRLGHHGTTVWSTSRAEKAVQEKASHAGQRRSPRVNERSLWQALIPVCANSGSARTRHASKTQSDRPLGAEEAWRLSYLLLRTRV